MSSRIAVIGGTGLIGWQISQSLRASRRATPRVISRGRPPWLPPGVEHVTANIEGGPSALARRIEGSSVIVNAVSYVGEDPHVQAAVNVDGVAAVVEAARLLGGLPLVHLSTAGVYGTLPFPGGDARSYAVSPESALSRTRSRGDAIAEASGAFLVRPLFVTGAGDTHFLLPLVRAHAALGAWIEDGEARISVTSAEAVGRIVADIAARTPTSEDPRLVHAVPAAPVSVRQLLSPLLASMGVFIDASLPLNEAVSFLEGRHGVPRRKVAQFASDYFISSSVATDDRERETAQMPLVSADAMRWYVAQLVRR